MEGTQVSEFYEIPKFLYDCILGLMGQNKKRIEISLQHLNFLIRKSLADLRIHHKRLMEVLLRIRNAYGIENFEKYKTRALVSLVVMLPE